MIREILHSIKEIIFDYIKHRLFPITVLVFVLFFILVRRLFVLQIIEGEEHMENFIYTAEKTLTIESVRGKILDRNGKVLAYNELSYSVIFSNDPNLSTKASELGMGENELKNQIVSRVINILEINGDELYVDFPIELTSSGEYQFTVSETQRKNFIKNVYSTTDFDSLPDEKKNSTAADIVSYLDKELFEISDEYEPEMALKILSCRYKLWLNRYQQYVPVTIAYDISEESNAAITEYADEFIGIDISVKSLRKYNDAEYFAHIIGYIGSISDEEMTNYNANLDDEHKYTGSEMVGKTGIEQYCEEYLRGSNGYETMYVDNLGKVIETIETVPAVAGNDVYLTIDADLQKYCYDNLEKEITAILLANLVPSYMVAEEENAKIPISDVYFGLFNNNYLTLSAMTDSDASDLEKSIYEEFTTKKENTLEKIDKILTEDFTPVSALSSEYQEYMEYICEILVKNDIFDNSLISPDDQEFINYTSGLTSLEHYLKYAISIEAIDVTYFEAESNYYDTDEIYELLCDYIINYLNLDTEFDKMLIHVMIQYGEISGDDMVELLYLQGILKQDGDLEYEQYKQGVLSAYDFMRKKLENLDITPDMLALDPCSGSVVITDIDTGDVLAMVSYPSYDNNYLTNEVDAEYYNMLLNDKTTPLYSRATQTKTAPGSTYKVLSSVAGLTEGQISQGSYYYCNGEFTTIESKPRCWYYPMGHGSVDVTSAIQHSCNVFFYNLGYYLSIDEDGEYNDAQGINILAEYAGYFGLNQTSGVELPEISPTVSDNDAVRSAIGQGRNSYAPVQLARYATTIANSGTCFNLTLIDRVTDYEGNLIFDNQATVLNQLDNIALSTWESVHIGMRNVVKYDVASTEMINQIDIAVAGKSGTAQESDVRPNHALFISYAPYEAPEVSVTCVIQNGYSSGNARELTGFIYAYMYDPEELSGAQMTGSSSLDED
ncbi:MAG: hypothetical protein E7259_02925 [Lachnospiraceae bacterium]|nr:hypothetical protein [Lachnospiraceae bacterium]